MKFVYCFLLAVVMLFSAVSCRQHEDGLVGEATLQFRVSNYEQRPMDDITRGSEDVSALPHLSLGIFDEAGQLHSEIKQESGEAGYGQFSVTLPYGAYTLVFVGYSGSHAVQMQSPTAIRFADNYVPNCFVKAVSLTVSADMEAVQNVELSRAVACFSLRCSNGLPDDMVAMEYTARDGGVVLNALTGLAAETTTWSGRMSIGSDEDRKGMQTFNVYTFLKSESSSMEFTFRATRQDGSDIRSRSFVDVPMKLNQRTYYTGDFFASDQAGADDQPGGESTTTQNSSFAVTLLNGTWDKVELMY